MQDEVDAWLSGLEELFARFAGRFGRVEPRRRAGAYVRGLLAPVERKNGWQLAEAAGDVTPDGMQRLLNGYAWDAEEVRDDVRDYVVEHLGEADAVLIPDETGFLKKGQRSVGVQRQYSGTAGRIENCQVGVFLAYASNAGRALVDRELYLPKSWTQDPARRGDAGVPEQVDFATKPMLARAMLARALEAGVPFGWVAADEAYGQDGRFRAWLEAHQIAHVLAVPRTQTVIGADLRQHRAHKLVAGVPTHAWERRSAGHGAKGPRCYDWAAIAIRPLREPGWAHWLLARRSLTDPTEIAYYLAYAPETTTLAELVRVAGVRWAVEECFQTAKGEVGLDHYQVRRHQPWHRHITLAMAAAAFLAVTRAQAHPAKGAPPAPRQASSG